MPRVAHEETSSFYLDKMAKSNHRLQVICRWVSILALIMIGHWVTVIWEEGFSLTSSLMLMVNVVGGWVLHTMSRFYEREGWKRWR